MGSTFLSLHYHIVFSTKDAVHSSRLHGVRSFIIIWVER